MCAISYLLHGLHANSCLHSLKTTHYFLFDFYWALNSPWRTKQYKYNYEQRTTNDFKRTLIWDRASCISISNLFWVIESRYQLFVCFEVLSYFGSMNGTPNFISELKDRIQNKINTIAQFRDGLDGIKKRLYELVCGK